MVDPKNADFLQLYEDDTIHAAGTGVKAFTGVLANRVSVQVGFWVAHYRDHGREIRR